MEEILYIAKIILVASQTHQFGSLYTSSPLVWVTAAAFTAKRLQRNHKKKLCECRAII